MAPRELAGRANVQVPLFFIRHFLNDYFVLFVLFRGSLVCLRDYGRSTKSHEPTRNNGSSMTNENENEK